MIMQRFTQSLRNIGIIGRITMLEGARKQVFHVLMLVAVFLIFGSATLARFDQHVQMKMLTDLCLFSMFLISAVIAITITVTGVPGEMEQKTVYPVIAKPVRRWEFIAGKYAGAMGTVAIGMAVMAATFAFLQVALRGHLDPAGVLRHPVSVSGNGDPGRDRAVAVHVLLLAAGLVPVRRAVRAGQRKVSAVRVADGAAAEPVQRVTITLLYHLLPAWSRSTSRTRWCIT